MATAGSVSVIVFFIIALMTGNVWRTFSILLAGGLITLAIISFVNEISGKEVRFQFKAPLIGMGTLFLLLALVLSDVDDNTLGNYKSQACKADSNGAER